jgi:hypothetical protein
MSEEPRTVQLNITSGPSFHVELDTSGGTRRYVVVRDMDNARVASVGDGEVLELVGTPDRKISIAIPDHIRRADGRPALTIKRDDMNNIEIIGPREATELAVSPIDGRKMSELTPEEKRTAKIQSEFNQRLAQGMDPQVAMAVATAKVDTDKSGLRMNTGHHDQNNIETFRGGAAPTAPAPRAVR